MHEAMKKAEKICEMKDRICQITQEAVNNDQSNVGMVGDLVDMVKDLCEAEKDIWKACYYKSIVEAMERDGEENERAGYDNYRYASGRFAPKGHGHRMGYSIPYDPRVWNGDMYMGGMGFTDPRMWGEGTMGFTDNPAVSGMGDASRGNMPRGTSAGYPEAVGAISAYDRYRDAKRHYTETGKSSDREQMSHHARMSVTEAMETMRDIWKEADPELKTKMKTEMGTLVKEFGV